MGTESRAAQMLWHWAGRRLGRRCCELEAHYDTAAFIDAVHAASQILHVILPLARGVAHLRHHLRGTQMHPDAARAGMLENWNNSDGFLDGAEEAQRALLDALWRTTDEPICPELRECIGPDVVRWLQSARSQAEGDAGDSSRVVPVRVGADHTIDALSVRFERLHGPESLDHIRGMSVTGFRSIRDPEVIKSFQRDTLHNTTLNLDIAAVVQARVGSTDDAAQRASDDAAAAAFLRRYHRLTLACDFGLCEGIASPFRISGIEEVLAEEQPAVADFGDPLREE
eukprot:gnl/TRDRNA2_/TRDRNA2_31808_c0_seq2.p1 gnl/TRDRNA2_/TRDRNA2_31808_c0~~gnl/TRDRNA2_/TRDRNA2_31808_c0_seq2.p1  ORF type:complete len:284 (+),score=49.45 gnl/TRDRNA2_/TRDRNA2_31808_c0_seq2:69-920(+)